MIDTVHVVFKTHLDLGFTGSAADVLTEYLERWIPSALDLADELDGSNEASFVWTTGSWLVKAFLDSAGPAGVARMERAISAGRIAWHALPCSTHTELMDEALVEYGLSISKALDERFGTNRIAAKMTDVPGHTIGLVPHLSRAGVRYLHVGVNPVSALPEVPELFVWRAPDGSDVVVHYQGSYGSTTEGEAFTAPGLSDALYLAHTNDNHGPPTRDQVIALFARLRAQYPRARVIASTLDAFAEAVESIRGSLPVVADEIGDSWIHGPASDPLLLSRFRSLLRTRSALVLCGALDVDSNEYRAFSDPLLLVAEHTWGKDQKVFLPDFTSYDRPDFEGAREQDHLPGTSLTYSAFERSWSEQRDRIDQALAALSAKNRAAAEADLAAAPDEIAAGSAEVPEALGRFRARFDGSGALASLVDDRDVVWFDTDHTAGRFLYQTFNAADYDTWVAEYCRDLDANADWAMPDQTRLGLREHSSTARHAEFVPRVVSRSHTAGPDADVVWIEVELPNEAVATFGAPERLTLRYAFSRSERAVELSVTTHGKRATRLPEASLLAFIPAPPGRWVLDKLGTAVDARSVVRGGNRRLHAVSQLRFECGDGTLTVLPLDSPVIAVGRPRLLRFDDDAPEPGAGVSAILHDNLWPTNFRQWFEDDVTSRFRLSIA